METLSSRTGWNRSDWSQQSQLSLTQWMARPSTKGLYAMTTQGLNEAYFWTLTRMMSFGETATQMLALS